MAANNGKWLDSVVKWSAGITVPMLIFVISALWSVSGQVSAKDARIDVLEVRVGNLEQSVREMKDIAQRMQSTAQDIRVDQATFQAKMSGSLENLKEQIVSASRPIRRRTNTED